MNYNDRVRISLHRFHDKAAVSFLGVEGETVYVTPQQAKLLAKALLRLAKNIEDEKFQDSSFGAVTIE